MRLYNTMSRKKEEFIPLEDGKVKMYVCGPTVYDFMHIGNARPFVVFDTVRRYLEYKGFDVNFIQNFTDVDDKIIKRANEENVDMKTISERYIKEVYVDAESLNVKKATYNPKVTDEISEIIEMIKTLIEKNYAYEKNGTVYFNTENFKNYGALSGKKIEDLLSGARVDVDMDKLSAVDFVLWKPKKENEPYWESPWGKGRPGWHIECSVMAKKYLGDMIDIHAGGEDLIFPHHENEIAQSECANGEKFAKYWMHNAFVNINNEKMSKSLGNFFTIRDITKHFSGDVLRFFIISSHYRSPINFSDDLMKSAETSLDRIKNCFQNLKFIQENTRVDSINEAEKNLLIESENYITEFERAMDDDFNTADAISSIFEFVRFANSNAKESSSKQFISEIILKISKLCEVLGIRYESEAAEVDEKEIEDLISQRTEAKKNKDFKKADEIRNHLSEMGIVLEDTRLGVRWSYKGK